MIKSFNDFVIDNNKSVIVSLIELSIPSIEFNNYFPLIEEGVGISKSELSNYKIFLKKSSLNEEIIPLNETAKYLRKMYPKFSRCIMENNDIRNYQEMLSLLYAQGYNSVTVLVNECNRFGIESVLNKYNKMENSRHGFYNFKNGITVRGISFDESFKTKDSNLLVEYSKLGEYVKCESLLPEDFSSKLELINKIRHYFNLSHITPKETIRENYLGGNLFSKGDVVMMLPENEEGKIVFCGTNYVIIESSTTFEKKRKWLDSVKLLKERELSNSEKKEKERIVIGMKKNKEELKNKYGNDWKSVMYATATKQAKRERNNDKS